MTAPDPTHLSGWLRARRNVLLGFAAAAAALIVLAWLLPVADGDAGGVAAARAIGATPENPAPEDLTAFLDVDRWGVSLREINARIAEEEALRQGSRPGLNPALKALGYVGRVLQADAYTVLLTTPEGTIARLSTGDVLPDGRVLASVDGNSISLRSADTGAVEVLELFPRPPVEVNPGTEAQ